MEISSRPPQPGEVISFGAYPQGADGVVATLVEWVVLENAGAARAARETRDAGATEDTARDANGACLLVSRHILDCRRYHGRFEATSWGMCDLRRWLHEEFLPVAFCAEARRAICPTLHAARPSGSDPGAGGAEVVDEVFLLSAAEVERATARLGKDFRRARGTAFARLPKPDGCRLYVMDKNVPADYLTEHGQRHGCSWWWLRDSGRLAGTGPDPARAAFVGTRASIRHYARVDLAGDGVRPALWVDLAPLPPHRVASKAREAHPCGQGASRGGGSC